MTRHSLVFFCAMVLLTSPVIAQSSDCDNAVDQNALNRCADQELKEADARLNAAYQALSQQLDTASLERLKLTQQAWVSYRDALCAFESEPSRDGSVYPLVLSNCLEEATNAQISILEEYLSCEEGDVSCVNQ